MKRCEHRLHRGVARWATSALCSALICTILLAGLKADAEPPGSAEVLLPDSVPPAPFKGVMNPSIADSREDWPTEHRAPSGSPNILLIMTDDMGFAALDTFGGPVPAPNINRLAADGLRYNRFHTPVICSATRAALLTGRNHHAVGTGFLTDRSSGYPGYNGIIPRSAATFGRVMTGYGYSTAFFGKHHNAPSSAQPSAAGPFDLWPTGLGFQYFFGFVGGSTDQWRPNLFRGTARVSPSELNPSEMLDYQLATDAISWIHSQKAAAPDKPFFIYFATGSTHSPHQAPPDWIARFKGQFDQGWDVMREQIFARQKAEGIIPSDTVLTPRPAAIPAWASLSPEQQRAHARMMEVYAAFAAYEDAQIGRVLAELRRMGQLDNTLVIFIAGDNGASGEGGVGGALNEPGERRNGVVNTPDQMVAAMPLMGTGRSHGNYSAGWGWAMNTPFQWMKQVASHLGGARDGVVISWPDRIKERGIRSQYSHVVDIYPTILEAAGVRAPTVVDGVRQQRLDGVGLGYSFDHPDAASRHTTQYYEMTGNRGIYHDGWLANTVVERIPWLKYPTDPTKYRWELYDLSRDFSQSNDLSGKYTKKLNELQMLFDVEARRNNVYPLISTSLAKPKLGAKRTKFTYWGANIRIAQAASPRLSDGPFSITAVVERPSTAASGVLLAAGSWLGGWSFYLDSGRPVAVESLSTTPGNQFKVEAEQAVPAGPATIRFEFKPESSKPQSGGELTISVNDKRVASGHIGRMYKELVGPTETFDIGLDAGMPVTDAYLNEGVFEGRIDKVEVLLGTAPRPLRGALSR